MATLDPNSRSFGVDSHATGSAQYGGDDALTAFTPSQPSIKQAALFFAHSVLPVTEIR